jgi:branched-chain amino acid transport system substrate-binding protein
VMHAMEKAGTDRAKVRSAIESTKNFVGITGVFDFGPADHNGLDRRAAVMIQIADGQWRLAR